MTQMTQTLVRRLAATLMMMASPLSANAAPTRCSVDQGQAYIDGGRHDRAIREFSCVMPRRRTWPATPRV